MPKIAVRQNPNDFYWEVWQGSAVVYRSLDYAAALRFSRWLRASVTN